uniref:Fe2OG dioxygenase domain-containing protein n=1 Tax=Rhizophora mucronata TaxID=61149 RepID=A0A2P2J6S1_RHIMU
MEKVGGGIVTGTGTGTAAARKVQRLAEACIAEVPPQYIQKPSNRPDTHIFDEKDDDDDNEGSIPLIDLTGLDEEDKRRSIWESIGKACKEWGAFHVTNHGVDLALLRRMRSVARAFFEDLPIQEKLHYACNPSSFASQGYGSRMLAAPPASSHHPPQNEDADILDWRDYFDHHTLPLSRRNPSRWPHSPPTYREVVVEYSDEMKVLAQKLLGLISESLGLPTSSIEHAITNGIGDFYQNITVSYYPPCPQPHLTLGLQSHSDIGALTLLIQDDVPGLEVFKDSHWFPVTPLPHAILVLLADQTEMLLNIWPVVALVWPVMCCASPCEEGYLF